MINGSAMLGVGFLWSLPKQAGPNLTCLTTLDALVSLPITLLVLQIIASLPTEHIVPMAAPLVPVPVSPESA